MVIRLEGGADDFNLLVPTYPGRSRNRSH